MRKLQTSIFLLFLILGACKEDADKVIHTNLPIEAGQFLETSSSWGESIYFSTMQFQDYSELDSLTIPGCPTISFSEDTRSVQLDFDTPIECSLENQVERSGKIKITYGLITLDSYQWTLEYEDYKFGDMSISGKRLFSQNGQDTILESFESLVFQSSDDLKTTLSGTFTHRMDQTEVPLYSISSTGSGFGINPAGRTFNWEITEPRITDFACFISSEYLPQAGKENWSISRSPGREVMHSLEYIPLDSCKVQVYANLSDGRNLILNP